MSKAPSLRLDRLLANLGYGSRREIHQMAARGRINLDGETSRDIEQRVIPTSDLRSRLRVDGEPLDPLPGVMLLLNKPVGLVCSHNEAGALVYGLLPDRWRRRDPPLSAVGRLDKDTSGLLLITDDGALLHRIISPRQHIPKRYIATLDRPLQGDEAAIFASGQLMLKGEDRPLLPAFLEMLAPQEAAITVTEGRYHQVRRMFAAVGNHVVALRRVSIGALTLPEDLAPGEYCILDKARMDAIFACDTLA